MEFEVCLLGRFSVRRGGEEIPAAAYEGRLVRVLLRVLASRRGTFVPRELLVDALWPAWAPADPERNLNVMVARARRALGEPALIRTEPGGYCFDPHNRCRIDCEEFVTTVENGRALIAAQARAQLSAALSLWKGDPLSEDAHHNWAKPYRDRLFRLHQEALERGAQAALAEDDSAEAVQLAEQAVVQEPFREAAHLILARALFAAGDSAGALQVISCFKSRLAEILGLDPTSALDELEFKILNASKTQLSHQPGTRARERAFASLTFVGRQRELEAILAVLDGPEKATLLLEGTAGSGKSRLLQELRRNFAHPRAEAAVEVAAFVAERDEPWTLARSLVREVLSIYPDAVSSLPDRSVQALATIVSELEDLAPERQSLADSESRRALALEGAVALVRAAAQDGLPVFVDDVQWADPTSLTLLSQLSLRLPRIKMILAYRPEEVVPDGPFALFCEANQSHTISLGPLSKEAIAALVSCEPLCRVIIEQTDRSPLAVTELLRSLAANGTISQDPGGRWESASEDLIEVAGHHARAGQAQAFLTSINKLPAPKRRVMRLLALLGRPASARLLAKAASISERAALDALEALTTAGLVQVGEMGWDTAHDLIAETVCRTLEGGSKARLHALLAEALIVEGADSWEQASHLSSAGDYMAAAQAFVNAGRESLDLFATEEAERSANAGLALKPGPVTRSELLEIRAEARVRKGMLRQGRQDLREALPAKRSGPERSRIISKLAILISGSEDYLHAGELAELAVTEAGDDPATRARALAVGAMVHGNLNHPEEAERMGAQALELYRSIEDAHGVADILELRALHTLSCGHLNECVIELGRVVTLFQDSGKLLRVGQPRTLRSFALCLQGRADEAMLEMDEVLELETALGHAEGVALAHAGRSLSSLGLGRIEEATEAATLSVAVARNLEHRELTAVAFFVLGLALSGSDDPRGAEDAFGECITQSQGLPMFLSMAAARLATLMVSQGKLPEAQGYVAQAVGQAPPFSQFEVRLAEAELAAALGDPAAPGLAARALEISRAEGHQMSIPRLVELAGALSDS